MILKENENKSSTSVFVLHLPLIVYGIRLLIRMMYFAMKIKSFNKEGHPAWNSTRRNGAPNTMAWPMNTGIKTLWLYAIGLNCLSWNWKGHFSLAIVSADSVTAWEMLANIKQQRAGNTARLQPPESHSPLFVVSFKTLILSYYTFSFAFCITGRFP